MARRDRAAPMDFEPTGAPGAWDSGGTPYPAGSSLFAAVGATAGSGAAGTASSSSRAEGRQGGSGWLGSPSSQAGGGLLGTTTTVGKHSSINPSHPSPMEVEMAGAETDDRPRSRPNPATAMLARKRKKRDVLREDPPPFLPDLADILPRSPVRGRGSQHGGYAFHVRHPASASPPTVPSIGSLLHGLLVLALAGPVLVAAYFTLTTVASDLSAKHAHRISQLTSQIRGCAEHFAINRCDPTTRVPAMEDKCREWEVCMLMDPTGGGALGIAAEVAADVLNKLVDPLSYKTMGFGVVLLSVCLLFAVLWSSWRAPTPAHPPPGGYPLFYPAAPPLASPFPSAVSPYAHLFQDRRSHDHAQQQQLRLAARSPTVRRSRSTRPVKGSPSPRGAMTRAPSFAARHPPSSFSYSPSNSSASGGGEGGDDHDDVEEEEEEEEEEEGSGDSWTYPREDGERGYR